MYRLKINLDQLINESQFTTFAFNDIESFENFSNESLNKIFVLGFEWVSNQATARIIFSDFNEENYDVTLSGNDVLILSDTNNYVIIHAEIPDVYKEIIYQYIEDGIIEVLQDENSEEVTLLTYKQNSENNELNKDLILVGIINGIFNHAIGLKSLDIDVVDYVDKYNYIYIIKLHRYYYVDSIEFVSDDITRLHLREDVLMSWKNLIKLQSAFVTRYQYSTNKNLVDNRLPLEDKLTIEDISASMVDTPASSSFKNCDLDYDNSGQTELTSFPNVMIVTTQTYYDSNLNVFKAVAPSNSGLPDISTHLNPQEDLSFIHWIDLWKFLKAYRSDDTISSFIISVIVLPFNPITAFNLTTENFYRIYVKDKFIADNGTYVDINTPATALKSYRSDLTHSPSPYIIVKDFTINVTNEFYYREPYANYEIYVAFVGWVKIELSKINGKRLLIYYSIDVKSGLSTAYIYNYTDKYVVWSGTCTLGLKIDLTVTNQMENTRQKQSNDLNMTLGLVSSALTIGVGVASANPIAIAGGVLSAGKTIASNVNANRHIFERASTTFGSSDGAMHSNKEVKLIRSYNKPIVISASTYNRIQGKPYNQYLAISSMSSGYIEVGEIHFNPHGNDIYQDEISEITSLLQNGVII